MTDGSDKVPTLYVDFNEMLEGDLVLLSKGDFKAAVGGTTVNLTEGLIVNIYTDDEDDFGPNNLVASGVVEINRDSGWSSHVKWCCRIDSKGIRYEFDRTG